jgi:hypothetical protein
VNIEGKGKDSAEQISGLKGQCHEIFDFRFFPLISFTQAPENTFGAVSNIFKEF